MNDKQKKTISKFLSLILRHQPDVAGVILDENGWVDVDELLRGMKNAGRNVTREQLEEVVTTNDKQRFLFDETGTRIRANQGHSVEVELGYEPAEPPRILYHGTPEQAVSPIQQQGLTRQKRHHVHLHQDSSLASTVGQRRGRPVVLTVRSGEMQQAGFEFFVTPNQVWLTDHVPAEYIDFPE